MLQTPTESPKKGATANQKRTEAQQPETSHSSKSNPASEPTEELPNRHASVRSTIPSPPGLWSRVVVRVNDQNFVGSLSTMLKLTYVISVRIHARCLSITFMRNRRYFRERSGTCDPLDGVFSLVYRPGAKVAATGTNSGPILSELRIQGFRYEIVDHSGDLDEGAKIALKSAERLSDSDSLVRITMLCNDHYLEGRIRDAFWKDVDADVRSNIQETKKGNYKLTVWVLIPTGKAMDIRHITAFGSSVEKIAGRVTAASNTASERARIKDPKSPNNNGSWRYSHPGPPPEADKRPMGDVGAQGHTYLPAPRDRPSIESDSAIAQNSSELAVQTKMHMLEKENQKLRTANLQLRAAVEQGSKNLQHVHERSEKKNEDISEILTHRIEEQAGVIKQLRDVGRFWLGLTRLQHEKITQFFQGTLPEDDLVFQLAAMSRPDA